PRRRHPALRAELPEELRGQSAGLILADELAVERKRQRLPGRGEAEVISRQLIARLVVGSKARVGIVVADQEVLERAPPARPPLAAPLRRATEADLEPRPRPEVEARCDETD